MAANGKIWCIIKKYVIGTLITALLTGIGLTAYHIITSDAINAQQTIIDREIKTELAHLGDKIDSTQPAVVAEQIKNLQQKQASMDKKIDENEQQRQLQHNEQMRGQVEILKLLIQIKNNR